MMKATLMNSKSNISLVFIFIFLSGFTPLDKKGEELVKKIQKKYNNFKDIQVEFTQMVYSEFETDTTFSSGIIYIKDKKDFRLDSEYETIVTDGKTIYTLNKTRNQLLIENSAGDNEDIFFPRKILFDYPKDYDIKYEGEEILDKKSVHKLSFFSKKFDNIISEFIVWIDKNSLLINKVKTLDLNENVSIYLLDSFLYNQNLKNDFFEIEKDFTGEIVDMREY